MSVVERAKFGGFLANAMSPMSIEAVEKRLASRDVSTRQTTPEEFRSVIDVVVDQPAVGVETKALDVWLAETSVTVDPTGAQLREATTGVTPASLCVAEYGTVALPCRDDGSELVGLFVDHHVVILHERDVVPSMETAFESFERNSASEGNWILATGASATADMGDLVRGAHGPSDVTVVILSPEEDL